MFLSGSFCLAQVKKAGSLQKHGSKERGNSTFEAPPNGHELPSGPGDCTPESEGDHGSWLSRNWTFGPFNDKIHFYWLGRDYNTNPLQPLPPNENFYVGINKASPASVMDVHFPFNTFAQAKRGLSVTTGNCTHVGLVAGDESPSWVGSYASNIGFEFGQPFQVRAGLAPAGYWNPSIGTFIHLDPATENIGVKTSTPGFPLDVNGSIHTNDKVLVDGKVGIGTNSPLSHLQIGDKNIFYSDGAGTSWARNWYYNGTSSQKITPFSSDGAAQIKLLDNGGITFKSASPAEGTLTERLSVLNDGNVGIGTSNPTYKLDVAGDLHTGNNAFIGDKIGIGTNNPLGHLQIGDKNIFYSDNAGTSWARNWYYNGTSSQKTPNNDNSGAAQIKLLDNGGLLFRSAGPNESSLTAKLSISNNGNVGIGDATATTKLTVGSTTDEAILSLDASTNKEKGIILAEGGAMKWKIAKEANSDDLVIGDGSLGNSIRIVKSTNIIGTHEPRVVIGEKTVSPANSSQFGSNQIKLSVDGVGVFKEIAVLEPGQWADYVFDKDYKLLSLDSVETFVNQNHHLPDVPSANEVAQNGLKIGEMNTILLRKIEELTLYIIELKKKSIRLEEEVEKLKK